MLSVPKLYKADYHITYDHEEEWVVYTPKIKNKFQARLCIFLRNAAHGPNKYSIWSGDNTDSKTTVQVIYTKKEVDKAKLACGLQGMIGHP